MILGCWSTWVSFLTLFLEVVGFYRMGVGTVGRGVGRVRVGLV